MKMEVLDFRWLVLLRFLKFGGCLLAIHSFHLLQVFLRIEIFYNTTFHSIFDGRAERSQSLFPVFQKAKAGAHYLAGIVIAPAQDACLDEFLEMRPKCYGCRFQNIIYKGKVTNIS